MDNLGPRITALRRYISLLRQEEHRLDLLRRVSTANEFDVAIREANMRAAAQKIIGAERELKRLEDGLMKRQASSKSHTPL